MTFDIVVLFKINQFFYARYSLVILFIIFVYIIAVYTDTVWNNTIYKFTEFIK